ncbi:cobalamin-dependent protein [Nocardioides sp. ChNu-153]|uniref:cobalamin B12-binding domain-containing protein n=1 Tax=unclassified Nocardioides TaxID=2615069 RepID=UPI002404A631|nr:MULTISPECIES: cobalamin-dependent protein [unclassified Nocardioides]MDF9717857.1 cobalamin-dependent protein [Nocardioides sp. ChNu-99]MDN7121437.1 cobalamin-dependent protein [Nocardioides sp. ChNu-153]
MTTTAAGLEDGSADALGAATTERYWAAVDAGDAPAARDVALAALDAGATLPQVLDGLVGEAQRRVGRLWERAEWTVAREHAATAVGEFVVHSLRERTRHGAHSRGGRPLLVLCAEREWHALPALMLSARLEHEGHQVHYLGADVSTAALQGALMETGPRAVLVSASLSSSLVYVRRHVEAARAVRVPVVVGGSAFDAAGDRARRLGATAWVGPDDDTGAVLTALPTSVPPAEDLPGPGPREAHTLMASHAAVAGDVVARMRADRSANRGALEAIVDQVPHVVGALAAALLLDDPRLVDQSGVWLREVASARGCDGDTVRGVWASLELQVAEFPCASALLARRA